MSFYLNPLTLLNKKETQEIAQKTHKGFYSFNGELMHKDNVIGKIVDCIDDNGGLKGSFIFNTDHKNWNLDRAHSTFLESGYPFMKWNGQLYNKKFEPVATLSEIKAENQTNDIFNTNHKNLGHIENALEFIKNTGYPKMQWNGRVYDVEEKKVSKIKPK